MKYTITAALISFLSAFGYINPARAVEVVEMEAIGSQSCAYVEHQLVCNVNAYQVEDNQTKITGLFVFNCETSKMTAKEPTVYMDGLGEQKLEGSLNHWYARDGIEQQFVSNTCHNFVVISGGEDGILADRYYEFKYTADGRLACKNARDNKLYPLSRCRDAIKTR